MSSTVTYDSLAHRITDLRERLAVLTETFTTLQVTRHHCKIASDYLALLEQQIVDSGQTAAWLEFLETISMRERYETTVGHANRAITTTGY